MTYYRGHRLEQVDGKWIYSDTKEPVENNERECGYCGKENTQEGHDGCLGTLPGVMNACCGHGEVSETYVQFWDGRSIHGAEAKEEINERKAVT